MVTDRRAAPQAWRFGSARAAVEARQTTLENMLQLQMVTEQRASVDAEVLVVGMED